MAAAGERVNESIAPGFVGLPDDEKRNLATLVMGEELKQFRGGEDEVSLADTSRDVKLEKPPSRRRRRQ